MSDKFIPAVEDLGSSLSLGGELETVLLEVAADYDVKPSALRARAERAFGDLGTYRERQAASSSTIAKITREHLEYERELKERAAQMTAEGRSKFTAQDLRDADRFFGQRLGDKSSKS